MTQEAGTAPLISVVMTTYREDPYLMRRAIDSILHQTLSNLELIIVFEQGDPNIDVMRAIPDPRVVIAVNPGEPNRSGCHNIGLAIAKGRYLARMDGDDLSYPDRLEKQSAYLRNHPDIGVVASAGRLTDTQGAFLGYRRFPESHSEIVRAMCFTNPILHPVAMWDRERTGYDIQYTLFDRADPKFRVDDLDLWLQLIAKGVRFYNMPEVLLDYRQPQNYHRPIKDRWGGVGVRRYHWKVGLRHPLFWLGIVLWTCFLLLPDRIVNMVMGRNQVADRIRSIRTS
jgi:glycosyltransferase involved in cell wall biosynthesis